jgi:electron transfer flavoprotein beta subunit
VNVLVCVKRVPITGGKIVLTPDGREIDTRHLGFTISPHEECAVEEAVRLIEQHDGSVTVLTLGPDEAEEQLRDAMAIGADRGILLVTDGSEWDPQATTAAIVEAVRAEQTAGVEYDLLFFGNEAADTGDYQVGVRVAYALGLPCVTGVKGVSITDGQMRCEREVPGGREAFELPLPAVVSAKEGLNLPRYPSVPGRLRAKRKPLERTTPAKAEPRLEKIRLELPPGEGKEAQILGNGPEAAPAVVDVLRQLGLIS